jgi:hypothetical protein
MKSPKKAGGNGLEKDSRLGDKVAVLWGRFFEIADQEGGWFLPWGFGSVSIGFNQPCANYG